MIEREVELTNRLGLHARAAAKLVHAASSYPCEVFLVKDGEVIDAKSILGILLLAAAQGTRFAVRCDGDQETEALDAIVTLVEDRFGEGE